MTDRYKCSKCLEVKNKYDENVHYIVYRDADCPVENRNMRYFCRDCWKAMLAEMLGCDAEDILAEGWTEEGELW